MSLEIKDVFVAGKVGKPTKVVFEGKADRKMSIRIQPTCGCTKGKQTLEVEGKFFFEVEYEARKVPITLEKTVKVYLVLENNEVLLLEPKFKIQLK